MAENTSISWCDHTFNPWIGCTKVSPGCANCYAAEQDKLRKWTPEGWGGPRKRTSAANWRDPVKWNDTHICEACGASVMIGKQHLCGPTASNYTFDEECEFRRPRVFCASLADWLDDAVPVKWLADLLSLIHSTPNLDWLMLTKRPENWQQRIIPAKLALEDSGEFIPVPFLGAWLDGLAPINVWAGTTVENQEYADLRIPQLLSIPAQIRFLSVEPMIGPVLLPVCPECDSIKSHDPACPRKNNPISADWVICGGESGPRRRPFQIDWARSLAHHCQMGDIPFFMKQDAHARSGQQGALPEELWNLKEFPTPFPSGGQHRPAALTQAAQGANQQPVNYSAANPARVAPGRTGEPHTAAKQ